MERTFGIVMFHLITLRGKGERKEEARVLIIPLGALPRLTKFPLHGIDVHK